MKRDLNKFSLRMFKFVQRSQQTIFSKPPLGVIFFCTFYSRQRAHHFDLSNDPFCVYFYSHKNHTRKVFSAAIVWQYQTSHTSRLTIYNTYTNHSDHSRVFIKIIIKQLSFFSTSIYYRLISCTSLDCRHLRAADHAAYIIWRHFLVRARASSLINTYMRTRKLFLYFFQA